MSVSKLCSTMVGIRSSASDTVDPEKYTYKSLQDALAKLDEIVGYEKRGGRIEHRGTPGDPEGRRNDYLALGRFREDPKRYGVETAPADIFVTDENGDPLTAELKFFPDDENTRRAVSQGYTDGRPTRDPFEIAAEIYGAPYGKGIDPDHVWYDYLRRMTGDDGRFSEELPVGKYMLEIDKGSEFEIVKSEFNNPGSLKIVLKRLINMGEDSWYVGDLHHHSAYSSPAYPPQGTDYAYGDPETVSRSMRAKGLTFGALSDHHNTLNHREWEKTLRTDFLPILSKEISTSNGHVLQLNTDPDVIYRIPPENERTPEYMRGEFVRTTDEIKKYGGHPQINHPRDMQKAISFPPEFTDMIDIFYTMEIWNGSHPLVEGCTNGKAMKLWLDCLERGVFLGATTGSDTHDVTCEFWFDAFSYIFGLYLCINAAIDNTVGPKNKDGVILSTDELELAEYADEILREELPLLKKWGHRNLSSGCVRTYVRAEGERTPENLLANLRTGNSFLTNGPLIVAKPDGNEVNLKIVSNRSVKMLKIYGSGNFYEEISLAGTKEHKNGGYYINCRVFVNADEHDWFIFEVMGEDFTTKAITNPFFTHK